MAAPKALFDLQFHINRAAGRPPRAGADYQPAPLIEAIGGLTSESRQVRHMMAGAVLSSRIPKTPSINDAVRSALLWESRESPETVDELMSLHQARPASRPPAGAYPLSQPTAVDLSAAVSWDEQSEVTQNGPCTTANAWLRTTEPLATIARKLDPQNWDEAKGLVDAAFGISPMSDCSVTHTVADETPLGDKGYENKRLHEQVSASLGSLSEGLACDLIVSFIPDFGSKVPNHALYELYCDHRNWLDRNEGHCYVREDGGSRLLFASKHLCFNDNAPALLKSIAPILLPIWLRLILTTALP